MLASEAIYEMSIPENDLFNTKANYDATTKKWILNGSKSFVISAPKPAGARHLFLVLAQTQPLNVQLDTSQLVTLFLVESDQPGVTISPTKDTLGCRNAKFCTVHFKDVYIDEERILGEINRCDLIADALQTMTRLRTSLVALGLSKEILNELINYCTHQAYYGALVK